MFNIYCINFMVLKKFSMFKSATGPSPRLKFYYVSQKSVCFINGVHFFGDKTQKQIIE